MKKSEARSQKGNMKAVNHKATKAQSFINSEEIKLINHKREEATEVIDAFDAIIDRLFPDTYGIGDPDRMMLRTSLAYIKEAIHRRIAHAPKDFLLVEADALWQARTYLDMKLSRRTEKAQRTPDKSSPAPAPAKPNSSASTTAQAYASCETSRRAVSESLKERRKLSQCYHASSEPVVLCLQMLNVVHRQLSLLQSNDTGFHQLSPASHVHNVKGPYAPPVINWDKIKPYHILVSDPKIYPDIPAIQTIPGRE